MARIDFNTETNGASISIDNVKGPSFSGVYAAAVFPVSPVKFGLQISAPFYQNVWNKNEHQIFINGVDKTSLSVTEICDLLRSVFTSTGSSGMSALSNGSASVNWDGSNRYDVLTANLSLTLTPGTRLSGIYDVEQGGAGSYTLTINGISFAINTAVGSLTSIGWYISNNKIKFVMDKTVVSSSIPVAGVTPAAPTAGVVDDTADTFNWTNNPSFTALSDYEYTLDGGTTYATVTAKPLAIGDVAKAIGQVGVRVKAVGSNPASTTLYNTTAFTASGAGFTTTNRVAAYKNSSMVRSGGKVTTWTNVDGDTTKDFVSALASGTVAEPIDATVDGLQMSTGENLKQNAQMVVAGPVTYYALIKKTADGAILAGPNTNGYGLYLTSASGIWFSPGTNGEGFQSNTTNVANMADFKVVTLVWTPGAAAIVYIDGVAVGTFTGTISGTNLRINWLGGTVSDKFQGYMKGVAIFTGAHSAATVAAQAPLFKTFAES